MKKGILISIEGPDGAGKSTQLDFIKRYFEEKSLDVIFIREPGSTKIGENIRELLLSNDNKEMSDKTEMLLYAAARAQLVEEVIKPAIKEKKIVVCDRYIDSSLAYQGFGRELGVDEVMTVNSYATDNILPDLTLFLDIDVSESKSRMSANHIEADRIENEGLNFHQRVLNGYRYIAQRYEDRIVKVDAKLSIGEVSSIIKNSLDRIFVNEI